jgi:hypothetical protein
MSWSGPAVVTFTAYRKEIRCDVNHRGRGQSLGLPNHRIKATKQTISKALQFNLRDMFGSSAIFLKDFPLMDQK